MSTLKSIRLLLATVYKHNTEQFPVQYILNGFLDRVHIWILFLMMELYPAFVDADRELCSQTGFIYGRVHEPMC